MNLTAEQTTAIVNYLNAEIALENHLGKATQGYNPTFTNAVKIEVENIKKLFAQDEVDFLTSAAYRPELINTFIK